MSSDKHVSTEKHGSSEKLAHYVSRQQCFVSSRRLEQLKSSSLAAKAQATITHSNDSRQHGNKQISLPHVTPWCVTVKDLGQMAGWHLMVELFNPITVVN